MALLNTLNLLGRRVMTAHPNVNCGGCCVYSAILGEELEKQGYHVLGKVLKPWVSVHNTNIDEVRAKNNNRPLNIVEWEVNGVTFNHVFLEIYAESGVVIHHDSTRTTRWKPTFNERDFYPGSMIVEHMKFLGSSSEGWNERFDRKEIPQLTKTIKDFMSRLRSLKESK